MQNRDELEKVEQVTVTVPMSLRRAKQVKWQGGGPQGLIGDLYENELLSFKDLGWAVENAYNREVRSAALTVLAHQLGEATTLHRVRRFGPKVIKGADYLEERQLDSMLNAFLIGIVAFGALIVLGLLLLNQLITELSKGKAWDLVVVTWSISVIVMGIIATPLVIWQKRRFDAEIDNVRNFRAGREGEAWVEDVARAWLDDKWTVFRNLVLPGEKQDLDMVLVGLSGVWVLEIKAYKFELRVVGESWERKEGSWWKTMGKSPSSQAGGNAAALRKVLTEKNVPLWVNAVVVLTQQLLATNFINQTNDPKRPAICRQEEVAAKLDELNSRESMLTLADYEQIVTVLKEAAEQDMTREGPNSLPLSE